MLIKILDEIKAKNPVFDLLHNDPLIAFANTGLEHPKTLDFEDQKEIYVKSNSKFYKLSYQDIYFVEALADYVLVYTENTRYIVYSTMKAIEEKLKGTTFVRVHRSYIINLRKIQFIEGNTLIINGKHIPISKTYQEALFQKLNFL